MKSHLFFGGFLDFTRYELTIKKELTFVFLHSFLLFILTSEQLCKSITFASKGDNCKSLKNSEIYRIRWLFLGTRKKPLNGQFLNS
ncbi:hypothetical protein HMPREF2794_00865 [Bacteroides sp. HMSC067B03]|nr:hypothetical protein HMPREF2794_00865 [Bacteroides sp. HMSC067B03]